MASKTMKPAPLATVAGLGYVSFLVGSDGRENTISLCEMQTLFVTRRFGGSAERARIVASIAFGEAR
jgi:hypothetical protein